MFLKGSFYATPPRRLAKGLCPRVVKGDALRVLAPRFVVPPKVLKHFATLDRATPTLAASRVDTDERSDNLTSGSQGNERQQNGIPARIKFRNFRKTISVEVM